MLGVSCKLYPKGYALALELTSDDSFFLSIADISDRRPFLCVKGKISNGPIASSNDNLML